MRVNIGDVVLIDYITFEGEKETGLFTVVYHEASDIRISTNFTAIKVSSEKYCYNVNLEKKYLPFLNHDSFLNCNQFFRFREDQVNGILGRLTPYYLNKTLQQTKNYFKKIVDGLILNIGKDNLFRDLDLKEFE